MLSRESKYKSMGGYHMLAAEICKQAFDDLKVAYLLEDCDIELPKAIARIVLSSNAIEEWFKSEEYLFFSGFENGREVIREAKRQVQEMRDGIRPMIKSAY